MKHIVYSVTLLVCFLFNSFDTLAQVAITSFSPVLGPAGTIVNITGSNFSAAPSENIVYFGTVRAKVETASATALTVKAPFGATHQPITVTTGSSTAYSKAPFLLTFQGIGSAFMPHSFTKALNKQAGLYPTCVVAGDLDGDGRPDLVVTNWNSATISLFRNISLTDSIAFADKVDFATPAGPESVALGDLDGDGKLDLAVANFDAYTISVFKNISTPGSFALAARTDYSSAYTPMGICIDDLNLDGRPDIAVANQAASSISVYVNKTVSNLTFDPAISIAANGPSALTTGDLNDDGKPELIAVSYYWYPLYVYRNTSTANNLSFAPKAEFWSNTSPLGSCLADLNADGKLDVAVANYNANTVTFFKNLSNTAGAISFSNKAEENSGGAMKVAAADLDGDSKVDIASVNQGSNNFIPFPNRVVFSNSSQAWQSFATGTRPSWIAISDLDSNGRPDVIVVNRDDNNITIFKNAVGEALVQPSGASPVRGTIKNKMKLDSSIQTYNGHPYVQRHYDLEPVTNPATATATVSLYFTQGDFDNFNAFPGHGLDLPHSPTDAANKANLRVYQHHGFSVTSLPGTYSGAAVEINPDDNKIAWNTTTLLWEVSFDVTGFSGFFISTSSSPVLPLTLLSFTVNAQDKNALVQWTTTKEANVDRFELRRSTNERDFVTLAVVSAKGSTSAQNGYDYADTLSAAPVYYYQLKMIDADGSFRFSNVIRLKPTAEAFTLSLYPNPAKDYLIVYHPASSQSSELKIIDLHGRVIKRQPVSKNQIKSRISLVGLSPADYYVIWSNETVQKKGMLVIK